MHCRARLLIVSAFLVGCTTVPTPPAVEPLELVQREYVQVPAELVKRCQWPKAWPKRRVLESNRIREIGRAHV